MKRHIIEVHAGINFPEWNCYSSLAFVPIPPDPGFFCAKSFKSYPCWRSLNVMFCEICVPRQLGNSCSVGRRELIYKYHKCLDWMVSSTPVPTRLCSTVATWVTWTLVIWGGRAGYPVSAHNKCLLQSHTRDCRRPPPLCESVWARSRE